eukprot:Nk52_evm3s759 gene=Nk52_evmTU3s759
MDCSMSTGFLSLTYPKSKDKSVSVHRMQTRHGKQYRETDYERLLLENAKRKLNAEKSLSKFRSVSRKAKESKKRHQLNSHKRHWKKETERLSRMERSTENELSSFLIEAGKKLVFNDNETTYTEGKNAGGSCSSNHGEYEINTNSTAGIMTKESELGCDQILAKELPGCKDLFNLLEAKRDMDKEELVKEIKDVVSCVNVLKGEGGSSGDQERQLGEQRKAGKKEEKWLNSVLSLQDRVEAERQRLKLEEEQVRSELDKLLTSEYVQDISQFSIVEKGIPWEISNLEWPETINKQEILDEIRMLDCRYDEQLSELKARYHSIIESPTGEWSDSDHLHFTTILDEYATSLVNRRAQYIERLKLEMPHKSYGEIVRHDDWYHKYRFYKKIAKSVKTAWHRARKDMFVTIQQMNKDENEAFSKMQQDRRKWEEFNSHRVNVYGKLIQLRQQKAEEMKANQEKEEKAHQESIRKRNKEEKLRFKKLKDDKDAVAKYHQEKAAQEEEQRKRDEERRKEMSEQARFMMMKNQERIDYRQNCYQTKLREMEERRLEQVREEFEKQKRIQELIDEVRVEAPVDPNRALEATTSFKSKIETKDIPDHGERAKLYELHGYTDKKMFEDQRFRMDTYMREAGIKHRNMAYGAFAKLRPFKQPRRDVIGNRIFHFDSAGV